MMTDNPTAEEARLELVRLDELDDGEFTAPAPDELEDEEEEDADDDEQGDDAGDTDDGNEGLLI